MAKNRITVRFSEDEILALMAYVKRLRTDESKAIRRCVELQIDNFVREQEERASKIAKEFQSEIEEINSDELLNEAADDQENKRSGEADKPKTQKSEQADDTVLLKKKKRGRKGGRP